MGINVSLEKILESKHVYSIVIAALACVIAYVLKGAIALSVIVFFSSFLLTELIFHLIKKGKKKQEERKEQEQHKKYQLKQLKEYAGHVRSCFKTMESGMLNDAIVLYRLKQSSKYYNERFIGQDDDGWASVFSFSDTYRSQPFPFIKVVGSNTKVQVVFDLLFYTLLQNYVENGKDEYPDNFDLETYLRYYENSLQ